MSDSCPALVPPPPVPPRGAARPLRDLLQLPRLLLLRAPHPDALQPDAAGVLLSFLLFAALTLGAQMVGAGWPGELQWHGAGELLSPFAGVALAAVLAVLVAGVRDPLPRLLQGLSMLLLVLPLAILWRDLPLYEQVGRLGLDGQGVMAIVVMSVLWLLPQLWVGLAAAMLAWRLLGASGEVSAPRRRLAVPVLLVTVLAVLWLHLEPPSLWVSTVPDHAPRRPQIALNEDMLYGQPRLLERQLAALAEGRPGEAELYFLGVAGYASQDVFLKEVRTVAGLFERQYATAGRSLLLANNPASAQELPLATLESLGAALRGIAARMNRDEDLLFLFLTSHGSEDHRFSLELPPFRLRDLDPPTLRRLLDEAGITRRVVVVSACYSGGFVPALADPQTLVITAAAADRNSFGCADENELTDFGRAYFVDALARTRSFSEAFALAKRQVEAEEKVGGLTPSLPQMAGGEALQGLLTQFSAPVAVPARAEEAAPAVQDDPYRRIARALLPAEEEAQSFTTCLAGMSAQSPSAYLARDPDYFNGLEQDARHWSRYLAAWEHYVDDYCRDVSEPARLLEMEADAWKRSVEPAEAEALARWLESPGTANFRQAYRRAAVLSSRLQMEHSNQVLRRSEAILDQVNREIRAAYAAEATRQQAGVAQ